MKTFYLLTAALCLLINTSTFAQQDSAAMMKAWAEYMTPGPVHQKMAIADGEWSADMTFWEKPDAPPTTSSGKVVNKMILGGRYAESRFTADMMGMAFEGVSTMAYDNARKVFISTWIDNMGTGITVMEGQWDDATHSMHLSGKAVDPVTGKEHPLRQVQTWTDKNHQVLEMFRTMDGKEMKDMEIKLTRK